MKYYIISGEASGDLHASNLVKELFKIDAQANIRAWGGDLVQAAGASLARHYREHAIMGLGQIIMKLPTILGNFNFCRRDITEFQPDVLILIDYSGFNLRIAKWAKSMGYKIFYYVSPQVWATRSGRVHKIKQWVDEMFVILPFEPDFYAKYDYKVNYEGHPLLDAVHQYQEKQDKGLVPHLRSTYNLGDKPIIALLPGSRNQEVSAMLPTMLKMQAYFPDYQFVIAGAPSFDLAYYEPFIKDYPNIKIIKGETYNLLNNAHFALVTSGTATLETAIFNVPQVVCYKTGPLFVWIVRKIIKVKYISLVNLILNKESVPELIQGDFNATRLEKEMKALIPTESPARQNILSDYAQLHTMLGSSGVSQRVANTMYKKLIENKIAK